MEKALNQGNEIQGGPRKLEPKEPSLPGIYLAVVFNVNFAIRSSSVYLISCPGLKIREARTLQ